MLGITSNKESDGSWTWSLPIKEAKGDHIPTVGTLGTLGPLDRDGPLSSVAPAYLSEEGQGVQGGQGKETALSRPPSRNGSGATERCKHDKPGGKDCYLCDPNHPLRLKKEGTI